MAEERVIRIGMVGSGFMAQIHSSAYHLLRPTYGHRVPPVELVRIAGGSRARTAAELYGWREAATDWREVVEADDVDVVDIVTPNDKHAEVAIAAAGAGKAVVCEKPLASDLAEAARMASAIETAGVPNCVCFVSGLGPPFSRRK